MHMSCTVAQKVTMSEPFAYLHLHTYLCDVMMMNTTYTLEKHNNQTSICYTYIYSENRLSSL